MAIVVHKTTCKCGAVTLYFSNGAVNSMCASTYKKLPKSYHVFEHQYKAVLNELEHANSNNIVSKLEKIISDGCVGKPYRKTILHPKVISNLKTLL